MPTSIQEAKTITSIFSDYVTEDQAKEFTQRLYEEVGKNTDNTSLKVSIEMFRAAYDIPERRRFIRKQVALNLSLLFVVSLHFAVLAGNLVCLFILPFLTPWYVALPIISLIINLTFAPTKCPLTKLEDGIRTRLGKPTIKHFMGYYVVWPLRRRFGND